MQSQNWPARVWKHLFNQNIMKGQLGVCITFIPIKIQRQWCLKFWFHTITFKFPFVISHNSHIGQIPLNNSLRLIQVIGDPGESSATPFEEQNHCPSSIINTVDSGARLPGFELWFCQELPEWPWAGHLSSTALQSYYLPNKVKWFIQGLTECIVIKLSHNIWDSVRTM